MTRPAFCLAATLFLLCATVARADLAPDPQVWIPYSPTRTTPSPSTVQKTVTLPVPARDAALALLVSATLALAGVSLERRAKMRA